MRRRPPPTPEQRDLAKKAMEKQARGAQLQWEGPRCAAEIVNGDRIKDKDGRTLRLNRRRLRRWKHFYRHLPEGAQMPAWFALGLETLRLRPTKWLVEELHRSDGARVWRITWLRARSLVLS